MKHAASPDTPAASEVIAELRKLAVPANRAGMARYGIDVSTALGVNIPTLRTMARRIGRNHALACELWDANVHEARHLATLIADPLKLTVSHMQRWAADFTSWDITDQCCSNLFSRSPLAVKMAVKWSSAKPEQVKRAGFTLMACLSVHDKSAADGLFESFFSLIERESSDDRNYVRKAVNWALRQIGKRNQRLHAQAIEVAKRIAAEGSRSARWIAADALRDLARPQSRRRWEKPAAGKTK